jgi:hypothetical protein
MTSYYILFIKDGRVVSEGPWTDLHELQEFAVNVWKDKPARTSYAMRGRRYPPFKDHDWFIASLRADDAERPPRMSLRPVIVSDLLPNESPKKLKKAKT